MNYIKNLSCLPVILAAAFLSLFCSLFSGCYTLTQGVTLLGYLSKAVPLEKTDDAEFKRLVLDIRSFAINELGLTMSKNYTTYAELDRDYLASVVSASQKDSFQRHEWYFPVVGSMPYKGFFDIEDAKKERAKLEKKDLDVWIRRVSGFSTLGWFKDPLYSYMRGYPPGRLADLIIHELVHSTVFIKGQVAFNEELAEFIGSEGSRLYIENRYGTDSEEYREIFESEADSQKFITFIQELINELDIVYSSDQLSREEKLKEKERIIKNAQERFETEYESRFTNDDYRGFSELPVNNAYLELYRLYYSEDNFYADLYERGGRDLPAFISAAKTIKKKDNPRKQLENAFLR